MSSFKMYLFLFSILYVAIAANYPVEARRSMSGLSSRTSRTLTNSLDQSDQEVTQVFELHPTIPENVKLDCSRKYNESIDSLTDTLTHLNTTSNPPKNETAFIDDWVNRAEKNETDCLTQGLPPPNPASLNPNPTSAAINQAAYSYSFSYVVFFAFVSIVFPSFFV